MHLNTEQVARCYPELEELLQEYFAATVAKNGLPPLRMNWQTYSDLNLNEKLILFTGRGEQSRLLGFVMYYITPHLHHFGMVTALCDILAVKLSARGHGIARALMEFAEPVLWSRGATHVLHQFRTCYDMEPLFPKLGYKLIEQSYMKELN